MTSTPKMVDLVNVLILAHRIVAIEDISEQQRISVDTAQKIVRDELAFSKVNCRWVSSEQCKQKKIGWFVGSFYGISTFVGHLNLNPFLCK